MQTKLINGEKLMFSTSNGRFLKVSRRITFLFWYSSWNMQVAPTMPAMLQNHIQEVICRTI